MTAVYVAGTGRGVGKTALTGALALHAKQSGQPVALLKPFVSGQCKTNNLQDRDVEFYAQLSDVPLPEGWPMQLALSTSNDYSEILERVANVVGTLERNGAKVILDGLDIMESDQDSMGLSAMIVKNLGANVVLCSGHDFSTARHSLDAVASLFGDRLTGVVLNRIPPHSLMEIKNRLIPSMYKDGYKLVATVPEARRMLSPTVSQVASHLGADLINESETTEALVEHIMVGGWFLDQGAYVFSRRDNKAVVVRGDRSDIQMAALATSTACLILTAGMPPIQYVIYHAEQSQTPMLVVPYATSEAMERLGNVCDSASVHSLKKIAYYAELLKSSCVPENLLGDNGE